MQSFNTSRYKTDLQKVGKKRKDPFHVLPEGRKTEPGASGRKRNASLCPAEGRSLPGTKEKGWGKPTSARAAAEAQRNSSPSLKRSPGAQSALAKEPSAPHTDSQRVWHPGLNSTAFQSHAPNPTGAGKAAQQLQEGRRRPQPCRLICTSTNKRWKCLPSRAMNSCNRICA